MLIRAAVPEDAESIGAIRVAAWQSAYRGFMPDAYLDSLDPGANLESLRVALRAEIPPFILRIAEFEGQPVAFSILGKPRYEADESIVELWALNAHPAHWRRGFGQRLVKQALMDAQEEEFAAVELWCIQGNVAAQRLYEACGFRSDGRIRTTTVLSGHPLQELAYKYALSPFHPEGATGAH
jgi:RimJ/RimL family protein N-acetyltransferase